MMSVCVCVCVWGGGGGCWCIVAKECGWEGQLL